MGGSWVDLVFFGGAGQKGMKGSLMALEKVSENLVGFAPSAKSFFEAFIIKGEHRALGLIERDALLGFLEEL